MDLATDEGRALQERIGRLERQARWATAMVTVLALLCAANLAWMFVPHAQEIDASAFMLRDNKWRARAELQIRRDGSPMLRFNNVYGSARAVLHLREDGGVVLRMMDDAGTTRSLLSVDEHGQPSLVMSGADSSARMALIAGEFGENGAPKIDLHDRLGHLTWTVPAAPAPHR